MKFIVHDLTPETAPLIGRVMRRLMGQAHRLEEGAIGGIDYRGDDDIPVATFIYRVNKSSISIWES